MKCEHCVVGLSSRYNGELGVNSNYRHIFSTNICTELLWNMQKSHHVSLFGKLLARTRNLSKKILKSVACKLLMSRVMQSSLIKDLMSP